MYRSIGVAVGLMLGVAVAAAAPAAPPAPAPTPGAAAAPAPAPAGPAATPRDANGRPILAGLWNGPNPNAARNIVRTGPTFTDFLGRGGDFAGFEEDGG